MLERFLKYLLVERNYSVQTIRAYGDDLRQFYIFCSIEPDSQVAPTVSHRMVRAWLSHLLVTNNSARSVNRKLSSLRSFYKYLLKVGAVSSSPLAKVVAPKMSKKMPFFLTQPEMNRMIDEIDYPEGFLGIRDLLVVTFFYYTGVRVSELASLKVFDINIPSKTVKVLGKGSKERIIPLHSEVLSILNTYLQQKNEFCPTELNPYLVITNTGGKPYPNFLYSIVKKYMTLVTSLEKKSPHVLRHTFATHLLNQGADINAIKDLLGHANLAATQVYTHTSVEKLRLAYKQAHPRA